MYFILLKRIRKIYFSQWYQNFKSRSCQKWQATCPWKCYNSPLWTLNIISLVLRLWNTTRQGEGSQIWRKGSGYSRYQLRLDFFLSVVLPEFKIFWQDCRSIPNSKENPPKLSVCSHCPGHSQVLTTLTTGRWRHT